MSIDVFSPDEQQLLEAWFRELPVEGHVDDLLRAAGFVRDCDPYTRLDAWVGAFAVAEIQGSLPNCGICTPSGVILSRKFRKVEERAVSGLTRHLFTINWADSAPGISWPVAYTLVWIPVFDQFVVVASADGTDVFGYADFALGRFPAGGDWVGRVKDIVVRDWRAALDGWNQSAWAYLLDSGAIPEDVTMGWRREVWKGTECWDEEEPDEEDDAEEEAEGEGEDETGEAPAVEQVPETQPASHFAPVTHVWIRLSRWREFPPTPEREYPAEIIRDGSGFCYRSRGFTVPITEYEAGQIVSNPFLYYFSTALKVHCRIDKARSDQRDEQAALSGQAEGRPDEEVVS